MMDIKTVRSYGLWAEATTGPGDRIKMLIEYFRYLTIAYAAAGMEIEATVFAEAEPEFMDLDREIKDLLERRARRSQT